MLAPGDEIVLLRVIPEPEPMLTELLWALDSPQDEGEAATARDDLKRVKSQRIDPDVQAAIDRHTEGRLLGFIGQPRVTVLLVNLDLDARSGVAQTP